MRALGNEYRLPLAPAVSKNWPIEAAKPTHTVATSHEMKTDHDRNEETLQREHEKMVVHLREVDDRFHVVGKIYDDQLHGVAKELKRCEDGIKQLDHNQDDVDAHFQDQFKHFSDDNDKSFQED